MSKKSVFIVLICLLIVLALIYRTSSIWKKPARMPENAIAVQDDKKTETISWEDADKYYGRYVIVEGVVIITNNTGKVCFLNFHRNWKKYFTAVIFASDFPNFPFKPEEYYKDKKVRIKGEIKEYEGKPEMIISGPGQVEIVK